MAVCTLLTHTLALIVSKELFLSHTASASDRLCPPGWPKRCECSESTGIARCNKAGLTTIPASIPPYATSLTITGNSIPVISGPMNSSSLLNLNLANNKIQVIENSSFDLLPFLRKLNLDRNPIKFVSRNGRGFIYNLGSLRELSMIGCGLGDGTSAKGNRSNVQSLVYTLAKSQLGSLKKLNLASNRLSSLPALLLDALPSLEALHLRNNTISEIPQNLFLKTPELRVIDLSFNRIRTVSVETTEQFDKLASRHSIKVNLTSNPFYCDCALVGFISWMHQTRNVTIVKNVTYKCTASQSGPLSGRSIMNLIPKYLGCSSTSRGTGLRLPYAGLVVIIVVLSLLFVTVMYLNRRGIARHCTELQNARKGRVEERDRPCVALPYSEVTSTIS
ncbi:trophoblast glycoprotein-like [Branchiostoma floridae x Branchiostoma japonicum]